MCAQRARNFLHDKESYLLHESAIYEYFEQHVGSSKWNLNVLLSVTEISAVKKFSYIW